MRIAEVVAHPLTMPIAPGEHRTHWGDYPSLSILVVEVRTDTGVTGWGEGLVRSCPEAYGTIVQRLLRDELVGANPFHVEKIWQRLYARFHGKVGHAIPEAAAAVDIALWDVMGRAVGQPVHHLLGSMGRERVPAYASSISWNAEETALSQIHGALAHGFTMLKLKLGRPVRAALDWAARVRREVGDGVDLCADANGAYDLDEAVAVARGLDALRFTWLEEPIDPVDHAGYAALRARTPLRIAAGESEWTAMGALPLLAARAVGVFQPDCTRSWGISETRRMAALAAAHGVPYAPHLGGGGAIAAAANLHLAAAATNLMTFECMIFPSPLRDDLARPRVADPSSVADGTIPVPNGPGLGIEIDRDVLARYTVR